MRFKLGFIGVLAWLPRPCIELWGRGPKNPFLYAPHCQISWSINAFFESFRGQAPFSKGACGGQGQSPSCSRAPRAPTDKPKFEALCNRQFFLYSIARLGRIVNGGSPNSLPRVPPSRTVSGFTNAENPYFEGGIQPKIEICSINLHTVSIYW